MAVLDDRSLGWLRYLYRKATTPDSWEREGHPHEHWDNASDPPMLCFHRFDLIDSTYAVALMADRTPAWREVYGAILDELIFRHTGWWAAEDWLTQIGHDPRRGDYPPSYRALIPAEYWGDYDVPGWTANGVEPWGLQWDPVAADGNLFFKGFFLVMLGLHLRTTGDARWNEPFDMVRDGDHTFSWFHSAIAEHLHGQWASRPEGCHCENTKIWPYCLAGAGLGLRLHDVLTGTEHHEVFQRWYADRCRGPFLHLDEPGLPTVTTLYFDPIIDHRHELPVFTGLAPCLYLAPQVPDDARRLFEAATRQLGLFDPQGPVTLGAPRVAGTALWLAREWGLAPMAEALAAAVEAQYEPTWETGTGEFTWGFGLGEVHPRGQYNGTMAAAHLVEEGAWWRLANERPGSRFDEPTVFGVDFPTIALSEAAWDAQTRTLAVTLAPLAAAEQRGATTTFTVGQLPAPERAVVEAPRGVPVAAVVDGRDLRVTGPVGHHRLLIRHG